MTVFERFQSYLEKVPESNFESPKMLKSLSKELRKISGENYGYCGRKVKCLEQYS
jgi:hypothetical protein